MIEFCLFNVLLIDNNIKFSIMSKLSLNLFRLKSSCGIFDALTLAPSHQSLFLPYISYTPTLTFPSSLPPSPLPPIYPLCLLNLLLFHPYAMCSLFWESGCKVMILYCNIFFLLWYISLIKLYVSHPTSWHNIVVQYLIFLQKCFSTKMTT